MISQFSVPGKISLQGGEVCFVLRPRDFSVCLAVSIASGPLVRQSTVVRGQLRRAAHLLLSMQGEWEESARGRV